jgi:hypothetical protein
MDGMDGDHPAMQGLAEALRRAGIDPDGMQPLHEGLPEPIYRVAVDGARAVAVWDQLRQQADRIGYWPVIMGDESDFERHELLLDDAAERVASTGQSGIAEALEAALALDVPAWFAARAAEQATYLDMEELTDDWPEDESPQDTFVIPVSGTSNVIALAPVREAWQVPVYLRWGGWNECPDPSEQAAIMKRWGERYGAEVIGMSGDQVEMRVARPPQDREGALALAHEQFVFCTDNVTQGTQTIEALAASLLGAHVWHFWWD